MAYSALAVANTLLDLERKQGRSLGMTPIKLQRLLYYANAWNLRLNGEPLIVEHFEKWQDGPVIPEVWYEFDSFHRSHPISALGSKPMPNGRNETPVVDPNDKWTIALLRRVLDTYGPLNTFELSIMAHRDGTAWSQTEAIKGTITNDLIQREIAMEGYNPR